MLLRPPWLRMQKGIFDKGRGEHVTVLRREEGRLDACRAQVNAKKSVHSVLLVISRLK
jgi:hypothetical protein